MRHIKRMLTLFLICCLLPLSVLAEDVCTVDASAAARVTTDRAYLRVECPLDGEAHVVLSVRDSWGELIYQRDYGVCSGSFCSRDIHLPLEGETSQYTVELNAGGNVRTIAVTREKPLLTDSAVYASGLSLKELNGGSSRKYAVVLDLDALNHRTAVMPMIAGGMQVGEVSFSVQNGQLTVSAALTVDGRIDKSTVYVAADALSAMTLGTSQFSGTRTRLDRAVSLGGASYAAVMVQLTVTYDPAAAGDVGAGTLSREEMRQCWQLMQTTTPNEAVG